MCFYLEGITGFPLRVCLSGTNLTELEAASQSEARTEGWVASPANHCGLWACPL